MKKYMYRITFATGETQTVHAISDVAAVILAQAKEIERGHRWLEIDTHEVYDTKKHTWIRM